MSNSTKRFGSSSSRQNRPQIRVQRGLLGGLCLSLALAAPTVWAGGSYDEAQVVNVEPLFERVTQHVPTQVCRQEQVAYAEPRRAGVTGPLVGALIGGAIGNAVGHKKRNKQVGTAVGVLLGGSIGADVARHNRRHSGETRYRTEEVCHTETEIREEERPAGYRVTYAYAGQTHTTRMNRDPGPTLRVRVNVTPAG